MPDYVENPSKPEKILTGYGTVRSAELKVIYEAIGEMTPVQEIEHWFGRPKAGSYETDHIEDCLRFLRTLDMIERTGHDVLNPINDSLFDGFDLPFESRLLYHIRRQSNKQYHLAAVHDVAVREIAKDRSRHGIRRVGVDELVTAVKRATEYDLTWRAEKIEMWANLLGPIGALSFTSEFDEILLSPSRALLHGLLCLHQAHRENGESLLAALVWIDTEFFPVFGRVEGDPAVHVGVADVLENMIGDGVLALQGMSDRTEVVELPMTIDDTRTPADYEIDPAPVRPAYWYPLERNERRLPA